MFLYNALFAWIGHLAYAAYSSRAETAVRVAYGFFLLLQLIATLPHARRFYTSHSHGGYIHAGPLHDRLHTRWSATLVMACWVAAAVGIVTNISTIACCLVNLAFSRYFFVHMRWRSITRGMGAPGHMNYWFSLLTTLLAISDQFDFEGMLRAITVMTFRLDFALIMLVAGFYKISAGYGRGEGFEFGLVNPWWGKRAVLARRMSADSWIFRGLNHLGYIMEIGCALGMLVIPVAPYAAVALGTSFLIIGRLIRLTLLTEMVAAASLLFIFPGDIFDRLLAVLHISPTTSNPVSAAPALVIAAPIAIYLIAIIPAYAGMMINFYQGKRLPGLAQVVLDAWVKACGLSLWRVFTLDIVNFYVDISVERRGEILPVAEFGARAHPLKPGQTHVGEFICLTSLFTTLKYYPDDKALFSRRLLTYAASFRPAFDDVVIFRYISINRHQKRFVFREVAEFRAYLAEQRIEEARLSESCNIREKALNSPMRVGATPGSYAPR